LNGLEGTLFLNGQPVAVNNSVNLLPSDIAPFTCYLGRSHYPADPYFNGRLDSFRLNSRALSLFEILAPTAVIVQPSAGTLFTGGANISFSGAGYDYTDAPIPISGLNWSAEVFTNGQSQPAFGPVSGVASGNVAVPSAGPLTTNQFYRLKLLVTDSSGRQASATTDVSPQTSVLSLDTVPSGLQLAVDNSVLTGPTNIALVAGYDRTLTVLSPQPFGGSNYSFVIWSDGGSATHTISVPPTNATLTASFVQPSLALDLQGNALAVSWPDWARTLQIYQATNLTPPVAWTPVTNQPVVSQGKVRISVPTTATESYFRLQSP